ncbi:MAG: ImmA/IrrE family metallo-endopeptidase [Verrucomicrobia bacterium]|nr:ImmA/IrrE family metallo-endopeptidase [Verrucomicrobiota bacterium]
MSNSGEPQRLVAEARAQKLLARFGLNRPSEIILEDIAYALGVEVVYAPLTGAEAHLIRVGNKGGITISDRIMERGRQRFAIAHEIGHWELHAGRTQVFLCTAADLRDYQSSPEEIEANTFASELLMPMRMMLPKFKTMEPSLAVAELIANHFEVSLTAATLRYVSKFKLPLMVVFSSKGRVSWWRRNEDQLDYIFLEQAQSLSPESRAAQLGKGSDLELKQVPWTAWFPHLIEQTGQLYEQARRFENYDITMSLLFFEPK